LLHRNLRTFFAACLTARKEFTSRRRSAAAVSFFEIQKCVPKKQKSRLAMRAGGVFPALKIAKSLGRAPRARLVAVMMVVSMRPKIHLAQ